MIQKIVGRHRLGDDDARRRDLAYWLSRPAAERIAAVEFLRQQCYGSGHRLQRVVRIKRLHED